MDAVCLGIGALASNGAIPYLLGAKGAIVDFGRVWKYDLIPTFCSSVSKISNNYERLSKEDGDSIRIFLDAIKIPNKQNITERT